MEKRRIPPLRLSDAQIAKELSADENNKNLRIAELEKLLAEEQAKNVELTEQLATVRKKLATVNETLYNAQKANSRRLRDSYDHLDYEDDRR
jgi:uncharacterized coiled-coil protein SlyX